MSCKTQHKKLRYQMEREFGRVKKNLKSYFQTRNFVLSTRILI